MNDWGGGSGGAYFFLLTRLFYFSWVFQSVLDRGFASASATIGTSGSRGGDDTGHVPFQDTAPYTKNSRRGNVFCRGQTFPRHPVFWIFRLTNVMPDVETFHEHPHGETFPRRAVFPKTFPRQAFPLDVETFLIGVKRHARRARKCLATVSRLSRDYPTMTEPLQALDWARSGGDLGLG